MGRGSPHTARFQKCSHVGVFSACRALILLMPHLLGFVGWDRPSHSSFVNPVAPWASLAIHGGANRPLGTGIFAEMPLQTGNLKARYWLVPAKGIGLVPFL